jgi:dTDP-4-amino-4,6-dideoxygalactose transaminase
MNNVTAAIGLIQLDCIKDLLQKHRENGQYFDAALGRISGLQPARILDDAKPTYWLYTLLSDHSDSIEKKLSDVGIMASKLHRPNHMHTVFKSYKKDLKNLDLFYNRLVHIPCGSWVNQEVREKIVDVLARG